MNLKTGVYVTVGTMYARSYRVIANQGDRYCISIVNGPPNPYHGYQQITVSSLSVNDDKLLVDATKQVLSVENESGFRFEGVREALWEHARDDFELSDTMKECLSSTGRYIKTMQGALITGLFLSDNEANLVAKNPDAQINVRSGPGLSFDISRSGLVGDAVKVHGSQWNDDRSAIWYQVIFPGERSSEERGWIRSDLVQLLHEPKFNL